LFIKGLKDKNEWIRAYSRLGLMRINEEIPTTNFVRVEKMLQFFHMDLNNNIRYENRHGNEECGFTCKMDDFENYAHSSIYHYPRVAKDILNTLNQLREEVYIGLGPKFQEFEKDVVACYGCEHKLMSELGNWTDDELDYKLRSIAFELWKENDNQSIGSFATNERYVMAHSAISKLCDEVERREKEKVINPEVEK
jgi:hypothetical protein